MRAIKRVLIANRGEIACRIIRSCRKLGLGTVAVFSEADANALHVELADQAFPLGPAEARESYLRVDRLLEAAKRSGADAIHPGYGFLSERAPFAEAVIAAGLSWIGASPQTIADMGDKDRARALAKSAGVPIVPGSRRFADGNLAGLEQAAEQIGYPLLVKASAGGGGIGMRRVDGPQALQATVASTQAMAANAFGEGSIYLERYIGHARHVEVQIFGFGDGRAVHFYERDCSTQRRFQKVIEESPAPDLADVVRRRMFEAALALCAGQRYHGAGTVEFIVDVDTRDFYFLEMNTRIQVEHPVTEMNTDYDLVALQIDLARGILVGLDQTAIVSRGHAVECRIYAENPRKHFLPSPGKLECFDLPAQGPDVRIDTGFRAGDAVTHFYDPLIAKVICHAPSRLDALDRMHAALGSVAIAGLSTNVPFLMATLAHPVFRSGKVFTGFIDAHRDELLGLKLAPVAAPPSS